MDLRWRVPGRLCVGPALDAQILAQRTPALVVKIHHHVGAFSFATLSDHGGRLGGAANLGVLDCNTALRWVYEHIHLFGGDRDRITLAGHSAGGFLACAAAVSPLAPPLHALACFSGGASRNVPWQAATVIGDDLLTALALREHPRHVLPLVDHGRRGSSASDGHASR